MSLELSRAERRRSDVWSGALLALGSSVAVGSAIAATTALTEFPIMTGQAVRYGIAAVLLVACIRGRPPRVSTPQLVRIGVLGATGLAGFNICLVTALQRVDAGVVGAVVGAVPVVLALAGPLMAGRSPSTKAVLAAGIVTTGAVVVQWSGSAGDPIGLLLAAGALAGECAFSLVAIPLVREIGARATAAYAAAAGALLCGIVAVLIDLPTLRWPTAGEAAAIGYLAVAASAGAFLMWYAALDRIPVETAGAFAGVVPVCALLTGIVLGVAESSPPRFLGAAVVGVGVVLATWTPKRRYRGRFRRRTDPV
ncbi:EamA family transporter [Nocardia brasiliensis]|uniref:EamA family transporter n=1 Tax=Nocardia brasiliensis TaxID=37326 RepID=A0A6G9XVE0_NOCBR|nr:DMT family transporter [Nocardia brasiliensis]QIS04894.1 EamA family transporter [Nocardia brasiliensis]